MEKPEPKNEDQKTYCEQLIEAYKDLTPKECDYIFDVMADARREE